MDNKHYRNRILKRREVDELLYRVKLERERQVYQHMYVESRKMVLMKLFARQEQRHRHRGQTCGHGGRRRGWGELRKQR